MTTSMKKSEIIDVIVSAFEKANAEYEANPNEVTEAKYRGLYEVVAELKIHD